MSSRRPRSGAAATGKSPQPLSLGQSLQPDRLARRIYNCPDRRIDEDRLFVGYNCPTTLGVRGAGFPRSVSGEFPVLRPF